MNGKQLACVMLMMIIGVVTYSGQIVHKKTAAVRKEAKTAEEAAQAADSDSQIAKIRSERVEADSMEIRRFLEAWTTQIDNIQTSQEVEESVQSSIRASKLYVDSQKFEGKISKAGTRVIPRIIKAAIVAEDEYPKAMNWLGELEKKLPLARITMCRITPGKDTKNVRMELSLEIPLINLKADPTEKSGKKA